MPEHAAAAQPDTELDPSWAKRKHQVNGGDRVTGTHRMCVVGEFEGGGRVVTVAKWRYGAIAEEYIWM